MEVLINSKTDVSHQIEIIVPAADLVPHFEKAYREEGRNLAMPGFRRGKVPLQIIKKRFGAAIEAQVLEKLSNDFFRTALEERNIHPVGQPVLDDIDYTPGEQLTVKISYETMPEVTATGYKGLQLEKLTHEVTDEEVEESIDRVREQRRTLEEADFADDENFIVTCDLQFLDENGEPVADKRRDNYAVDLRSEREHRDLKAELYNMRSGETKDVEFTEEDQNGEEVTERVRISVHKIERVTLPEINEEFCTATSGGEASTLDALRSFVRTKLEDDWRKHYQTRLENEAISEIVKQNSFDVPMAVVNDVLDNFVEDLKRQFQGRALPKEFNVAEYRTYREGEAKSLAQWAFIREHIIEQEGITIEDADIEAHARESAGQLGIDIDRLLPYYKESADVKNRLLQDKLVAFILENASIKEVNDQDVSGTALAPFADVAHDHDHTHDHAHDHDHDHAHDHDHDHAHDHDHHGHDHGHAHDDAAAAASDEK